MTTKPITYWTITYRIDGEDRTTCSYFTERAAQQAVARIERAGGVIEAVTEGQQ